MDILIKNMEMPPCCGKCQFNLVHEANPWTAWEICMFLNKDTEDVGNNRLADCPLVALPEHGRLGDLDAIRESLSSDCPCRGCERFHEEGACMNCQWDRFAKLIDEAPTVLEATE